jgi:hypothetical protein
MENMENKDLELMEVVTEEEYIFEPEDKPRGKHIGKILIGAGIAGATILAVKGRDKIEKINVRRLEKKGYVVYKPMDDIPECEDDIAENEQTSEDTEK